MRAKRSIAFALIIITTFGSASRAAEGGWPAFLDAARPAMLVATELEACRLPGIAATLWSRVRSAEFLVLIDAWRDGALAAFATVPLVPAECDKIVGAADRLIRSR